MRCQTWESGAGITEDSVMEVDVGMRVVILEDRPRNVSASGYEKRRSC